MSQDNELSSNVAAMLENIKPQILEVKAGSKDSSYVLLRPDGMTAESIKEYLDEFKDVPDRRIGTEKALDVATFIELTNRFKDEGSVVFAEGKISANKITASIQAVLDYHLAQSKVTEARNGEHRVRYDFPLSKELEFWIGSNGVEFSQESFAGLLEKRVMEMAVANEQDIAAIKNLKPKFADPLEILALSRDLEILSVEKVRQAVKLQSGERTIQFTTEHTDTTGKPLSIPDFFMIVIPVFNGGGNARITVALRYRKKGEQIIWYYELYRIDQVFQTAFDATLKEVKEKTSLPLYLGSPANN